MKIQFKIAKSEASFKSNRLFVLFTILADSYSQSDIEKIAASLDKIIFTSSNGVKFVPVKNGIFLGRKNPLHSKTEEDYLSFIEINTIVEGVDGIENLSDWEAGFVNQIFEFDI